MDISNCVPYNNCNDGILQSAFEECDGTNLNGETCESLGYYGGTLACMSNCIFDVNNCQNYGWCGDSTIQSTFEECDDTDLNGEICESLGHAPGTLNCTSNCTFDFSQCGALCGDDTIQIGTSEECYGSDSVNCQTLGDFQSDLACNSSCHTDTSVCKKKWIQISLGIEYICGIKSDASLLCWGKNQYGQLGTGDASNYNFPQQVGSDYD